MAATTTTTKSPVTANLPNGATTTSPLLSMIIPPGKKLTVKRLKDKERMADGEQLLQIDANDPLLLEVLPS